MNDAGHRNHARLLRGLLAGMLLLALGVAGAAGGDAYRQGRQALEQERYTEALEAFREAVESSHEKADGAMYWMMYAELKMLAVRQLSLIGSEESDEFMQELLEE